MEYTALTGELLLIAVTFTAPHYPGDVRAAANRLGDALAPTAPATERPAVDWDRVALFGALLRNSGTAMQTAPRGWLPAHRRARALAAARLAVHLDDAAALFTPRQTPLDAR